MTPTSFRLPDGTLERIRALALPREPMAGVLLRALAALETTPPQAPTADAGALEARLERLERLERERSAGVAQPVAHRAGAAIKQITYPPAVRRMAVTMQTEGATPAAILDAIEQAAGQAPDPTNLTRTLARWAKY